MERYTKSYLQLLKPGITISNTIAAIAGYFLATSIVGFQPLEFFGVISGVALIIASASSINNVIDRNIDARMGRTKSREIVRGTITIRSAIIFAVILGIFGFMALMLFTNIPTVLLGIVACIWYVVIYGIAKRKTPLSTIIGGVSGALPPMAGYVAATGIIDSISWILFALMMVWQLPHFYAIAIFRRDDYKKAGLPVWSVVYGIKSTKAQIFFWIVVFALLTPLLTLLHATGVIYLIVMGLLAVYWVAIAVHYYRKEPDEKWAKRMFGVSLIVLLVMFFMQSIGGYLP